MPDLKKAYHSLIQETLLFLQGYPLTPPPVIPKAISLPLSVPVAETLPTHQEVSSEITISPTQPIKKPKTHTPKPSAWELIPLGPAEERISPLHNKLGRQINLKPPVISLFLLLPEEHAPHRLFLENVSRAITRTLAPCSVVLYRDSLFNENSGTTFLIPAPLVLRKFPHATIHQLIKKERYSVLPLDHLDLYIQDAPSKRALWLAIQNLFQS